MCCDDAVTWDSLEMSALSLTLRIGSMVQWYKPHVLIFVSAKYARQLPSNTISSGSSSLFPLASSRLECLARLQVAFSNCSACKRPISAQSRRRQIGPSDAAGLAPWRGLAFACCWVLGHSRSVSPSRRRLPPVSRVRTSA